MNFAEWIVARLLNEAEGEFDQFLDNWASTTWACLPHIKVPQYFDRNIYDFYLGGEFMFSMWIPASYATKYCEFLTWLQSSPGAFKNRIGAEGTTINDNTNTIINQMFAAWSEAGCPRKWDSPKDALARRVGRLLQRWQARQSKLQDTTNQFLDNWADNQWAVRKSKRSDGFDCFLGGKRMFHVPSTNESERLAKDYEDFLNWLQRKSSTAYKPQENVNDWIRRRTELYGQWIAHRDRLRESVDQFLNKWRDL